MTDSTSAHAMGDQIQARIDIIPPRKIILPQTGSISKLRQAQRRDWDASAITPTGHYLKKGDVLKVTYSTTHPDPSLQTAPAVRISDLDPYHPPFGGEEPQVIQLQLGNNSLTAEKNGIIHLEFIAEPSDYEYSVELTEGGRPMPHFIFGKHSHTEWGVMLEKYSDALYVDLISKRNLINVRFDSAKKHLGVEVSDSPVSLMKLFDEIVRLEEECNGIKPGQAWPHYPPPQRYHYIEDQSGLAWSWYQRMGFDRTWLEGLINPKSLEKDGWAMWHELGHQQQLGLMNWGGLTEVTNNILSLYVQTSFHNRSRLETENIWETIFKYLEQPNRDFDTQDVWVKLGMFWQFHLAFPDHFYAKLCTHYRDTQNIPQTDDEKRQFFILESSRTSGFNMLPFFEQWGIPATQATQGAIHALSLKQLNQGCLPGETVPVWKKRDEPKATLVQKFNLSQPFNAPEKEFGCGTAKLQTSV